MCGVMRVVRCCAGFAGAHQFRHHAMHHTMHHAVHHAVRHAVHHRSSGTGTSAPADTLVAVQLDTLINMNASKAAPITGVRIAGINFRDAADVTMKPWGVPSGGDWGLCEASCRLFFWLKKWAPVPPFRGLSTMYDSSYADSSSRTVVVHCLTPWSLAPAQTAAARSSSRGPRTSRSSTTC